MTHFYSTGHELIGELLGAGAWFAAGAVIGAGHFLTLRWNARMFAAGRSLWLPAAVQLARLALLASALAAIASFFGALLLAAAGGILITRTAVMRWTTRP